MKKVLHKVEDGIELKRCACCKSWKPLSEFYRHRKMWDALDYYCKPCSVQRCMSYRDKTRIRFMRKLKPGTLGAPASGSSVIPPRD